MARKKKHPEEKEKRHTSAWTKPRQFRLSDDTLAELDRIAEQLTAQNGVTYSRTDAIRYAARHTAKALGLE